MNAAGFFTLPKMRPRDKTIERVSAFLGLLDTAKAWKVEVTEQKSRRSLQQNAYLWGVVYPSILTAGSETLGGWTADDLHEYFLGEHFGWEVLSGFGRKRVKPIRRSSKLSVSEFMNFLAFIQQRMAELGVHIPDPAGGIE